MKNLRKSIKKIALVLLSSFIFVNCSQQDDNINTTNKGNNSIVQRSEKKYSGEELFKSIFHYTMMLKNNLKKENYMIVIFN